MQQELAGRRACVTGAGRGIGRAIALGFAHAGADVACLARSADEIEQTSRTIRDLGRETLAIPVDVRDAGAVDAAFERVRGSFGALDLLVVNAGIDHGVVPVAESDPEQWRDVIETNLVGAYYCARAALPLLRAGRSSKILFTGSGLGHVGFAGASAYSCSKAGLWMLTRVLAQELRGEGISVNELIPGPVETGMSTGQIARAVPAEWHKTPEDVVPLAVFLASQPDPGPTAQSFSLMRR